MIASVPRRLMKGILELERSFVLSTTVLGPPKAMDPRLKQTYKTLLRTSLSYKQSFACQLSVQVESTNFEIFDLIALSLSWW